MIRRADRMRVKDCKVIPGEAAVKQHRVLVMRMQLRPQQEQKKVKQGERIMYHQLHCYKSIPVSNHIRDRLLKLWVQYHSHSISQLFTTIVDELVSIPYFSCTFSSPFHLLQT